MRRPTPWAVVLEDPKSFANVFLERFPPPLTWVSLAPLLVTGDFSPEGSCGSVIVTGQEVVSREIQRSMEVCEAWPGLWLLRERARGRAA